MKNIEGIARSTMDGIREDEIKGIAAAAMEDININSNSDNLSQGVQSILYRTLTVIIISIILRGLQTWS